MASKNQSFIERTLKSVWHPCSQMKHHEQVPLLPVDKADGVWLYDFDGHRYLDGISSWWVNLFGHNEPRIKAAITQQLNTLEHVMLAGFTHEPVVSLSEKLAHLTGLGHAFYASDGASAIEIALKMSFHFWQNQGYTKKTEFLSLQQSYHGETIGALSVTDVPIFKNSYGPLLKNNPSVPSPDSRAAEAGESAESFAFRMADKLEEYLEKHHDKISAFIVEPLVQCATGMAMYHPIYLKKAKELCLRYQVHLIADEIAVGFGRTGTMFACEQVGIKPDFMCLSKGLSGGYLPLSVVLCTDEIYLAFYDDAVQRGFLHSHSYTGNPLACAAALATLKIFDEDNVISQNKTKTAYFNTFTQNWVHELPITHLRHQGMIWAFDVLTANSDFAKVFSQKILQKGLLLRPIGRTIYFMPPYTINEQQIAFMLEATQACLLECV
jgi:adenosylmethionine---8-amino-7-oxononanoate aminotransferase